jgi:hypothetical protein
MKNTSYSSINTDLMQIFSTFQNTRFMNTSQEINASFCLNLDKNFYIFSIIIELSIKLSRDPMSDHPRT